MMPVRNTDRRCPLRFTEVCRPSVLAQRLLDTLMRFTEVLRFQRAGGSTRRNNTVSPPITSDILIFRGGRRLGPCARDPARRYRPATVLPTLREQRVPAIDAPAESVRPCVYEPNEGQLARFWQSFSVQRVQLGRLQISTPPADFAPARLQGCFYI